MSKRARLRQLSLSLLMAALSAMLPIGDAIAQSASRRFVSVDVPGSGRLRLYVEERGSGRPIVLLHGFGASSYFWRKVTPALARSHRVIAIDLKGFGRSDKPVDGRYSVPEQARVVSAFLAQRGLTGITLVGHSLGGAVALAVTIAAQSGDGTRVENLVLIAAPVYPQSIPGTITALQRPGFGELLLDLIPPETIARQTLIGATAPGTPVDPADVAAYAMPLRSPGGRQALIATARTFDPARYTSLIARIGSIRARTLVLTCRDDVIVPLVTARRLARTIPRAQLTVFEGCNHVAPEEKPAAVSRRILSFIGE